MLRIFYFFLISSAFLFSQEEKRVALVIGNSNYEKGELNNPVNDAKLIAKTLDSLDFEVLEAYNVSTKRELIKVIREFGVKRDSADIGFVYYAGHGVQINNENFLLPTKEVFKSELDIEDYAVSVQKIIRILESKSDQVNILILDACRDNPFESNWNKTRSLKGQGLAKLPPPTGSLIAFSTDAGQTAPDGEGQNSFYTTSLSKNMLLENTTLDQVFRNVRTDVLKSSNKMQRPIESSQLTGQAFYLVKSDYKNIFSSIDKLLYNFQSPYFNKTDYSTELFEALEKLNIILSEDPNNIRALMLTAYVYYYLEQKDKALSYVNLVIEIDNKYSKAYQFRSKFWDNDNKRAIDDTNKAIELDPDNLLNIYWKIGLLNTNGKHYEAIKTIEEALILHPSDNELYRLKATAHSFLEQNELALQAYSKTIEIDPKNGFMYMQKGDFLAIELNKHHEALELYKVANNLKPDEPSPYESMILSYFNINSLDRIIELSEQLIALDINDPSPYYYLSKYYTINGNFSKAITYLSITIFKKIENNGWIRSSTDYWGGIYLYDLYMERSKLYRQLGVKVFECEDLNKGLIYLKTLENLSEEELQSPRIEFWKDKKFIIEIKQEIELLISKNCN